MRLSIWAIQNLVEQGVGFYTSPPPPEVCFLIIFSVRKVVDLSFFFFKKAFAPCLFFVEKVLVPSFFCTKEGMKSDLGYITRTDKLGQELHTQIKKWF